MSNPKMLDFNAVYDRCNSASITADEIEKVLKVIVSPLEDLDQWGIACIVQMIAEKAENLRLEIERIPHDNQEVCHE